MGRRSARSEADVVVVEGPVLLADAVEAGWTVVGQYVAPDASPVQCDAPLHHLAPGVLERVATTEHPQPVIGVVAWKHADPALLDRATFVVAAHELADPGNAGTLIRSAEAAGAELVVFTKGSVDVRSPKVVRASAGALFRVPVLSELTLEALAHPIRRVWGSSSHHGVPYDRAPLTGPVTLVMGNEARGLSDDAPVDAWLTIEHSGRSESLNVAMAATLLCFEVSRQRRQATGTVASR